MGISRARRFPVLQTSGAGKNSLQAIASTTTYLQRYTLKLALGLSVSHDDDGDEGRSTD
jgi:hypothetical protein